MSSIEGHRKPVLAIDLGGTKIAGAIVSAELQVVARDYTPTLAEEGPQPVIDRIAAVVLRLLESVGMLPGELGCIGVAAAGVLDIGRGIVTISPNLPGWENIPLRDIFRDRFGVDTFIINDASAAALGEHRLGVGQGSAPPTYRLTAQIGWRLARQGHTRSHPEHGS